MRGKHIITGVLATFLLIACDEQGGQVPSTDFGELTYHPPFPSESFVLCKGDTSYIDKIFSFEFNEDASSEGEECYAEFEFVDNNGNSIPTSEMEMSIKGDAVKIDNSNKFRINAQSESVGKVTKEITIRFRFLPEAKEGTHQGFLRMYSHKMLDRIDNCSLGNNEQETDVLQWTIHFKKEWNFLGLVLFILGLFMITAALLRIIYVRRPSVRLNTRLLYMVGGNEELLISLNNCTKGIISCHPHPQSYINRLFNGKYCYSIQANTIGQDIYVITDSNDLHGNRRLKLKSKGKYKINGVDINSSPPIIRDPDNEYNLTSNDNHLLTIKYM